MFPNQASKDNIEDQISCLVLDNHKNLPSVAVKAPELPPLLGYTAGGSSSIQGYTAASSDSRGRPSQYQKKPHFAYNQQKNTQVSCAFSSGPSQVTQGRKLTSLRDQPAEQHQSYKSSHLTEDQIPLYPSNCPNFKFQPSPFPPPNMHFGQRGYQHQNPNTYASMATKNYHIFNSNQRDIQSQSKTFHASRKFQAQNLYLEKLVKDIVSSAIIDLKELTRKENFRSKIEIHCQEAIIKYQRELGNSEFDPSGTKLRCFGSMMTGFATKTSDMDLDFRISNFKTTTSIDYLIIPRLLEKTLLDLGYGARLLTKTRVPIIKVCEKPTPKLLANLREERAKWENDTQHNEFQDYQMTGTQQERSLHHNENDVIIDSPEKLKLLNESKLTKFKQKRNQSLEDYCHSARQLLKNLGGHDSFRKNSRLDQKEWEILKDVCRAFILGLSSNVLSLNLQNYKSNMSLFNPKMPFTHCLNAIFTQAEGEQFFIAWSYRSLLEATDSRELEAKAYLNAWRELKDVEISSIDFPNYTRKLNSACQNLKKLPSLQLVFLKQSIYEDCVSYLERCMMVMDDLKRPGNSEADSLTSTVISHYISGINSNEIREILNSSDNIDTNLQQIGLLHQILQLAHDYEHALDQGLYMKNDQYAIKEFVNILKSLKLGHLSLPKDDKTDLLVTKLRSLPDPIKASPSKQQDSIRDHLKFPKVNVGVQCDINFSANLAIHNTHLLRCYSICDHRVREMVLFVKSWAEARGINTPYEGTLSSYGYVLMVLHYLVNVAQPFVCPNLQTVRLNIPHFSPNYNNQVPWLCEGKDIRFWSDEEQIKDLARQNIINSNRQPIGQLVRGFFEYFAENRRDRPFDWWKNVLSLRTIGGILSKQEKGWVGEKTSVKTCTILAPPANGSGVETPLENYKSTKNIEGSVRYTNEIKEIRHRYHLAIEDPFELEHNVARTVSYKGVICIRNEFHRALRIIRKLNIPNYESQEGLLDRIWNNDADRSSLNDLLSKISINNL